MNDKGLFSFDLTLSVLLMVLMCIIFYFSIFQEIESEKMLITQESKLIDAALTLDEIIYNSENNFDLFPTPGIIENLNLEYCNCNSKKCIFLESTLSCLKNCISLKRMILLNNEKKFIGVKICE